MIHDLPRAVFGYKLSALTSCMSENIDGWMDTVKIFASKADEISGRENTPDTPSAPPGKVGAGGNGLLKRAEYK